MQIGKPLESEIIYLPIGGIRTFNNCGEHPIYQKHLPDDDSVVVLQVSTQKLTVFAALSLIVIVFNNNDHKLV
jgi:hypothetical protein